MSFKKIVPVKPADKHEPAKPAPAKPAKKAHKKPARRRPIGG
jgi:hypothetical protein